MENEKVDPAERKKILLVLAISALFCSLLLWGGGCFNFGSQERVKEDACECFQTMDFFDQVDDSSGIGGEMRRLYERCKEDYGTTQKALDICHEERESTLDFVD